ncbi:class I SAM-dependent methyltransferase [Pleurocapsales cyanobacterium LEGE 06147]|nr:class I SAM-dependent methyltransferase [Pleurocapsales cyanobacterium LEGE 06147]
MTDNLINDKEKFFNGWAPYYDCLLTTVNYQAIHQRLLEYVVLEENAEVLDLGCGTGRLLNRLAEKEPTLRGIGIDVSREMLRQARARNQYRERLIFIQGNAASLPFSEKQFAAVFCTLSFLHYPNPQQILNEVSRVLSPGGRFYLVDSCIKEKNISNSIPWVGKIQLYNQQQREQLGREAGLKCLSHRYLLPKVLLTILAKPEREQETVTSHQLKIGLTHSH